MLMEISTIFLNISWFLYTLKLTNTRKYKINNILLLSFYFISRVCNLTYNCWNLFQLRNQYPIIIIYPSLSMIFILTIMNYKWFYLLCKKSIVKKEIKND